jgi:hypothetical protein
VSELADRGMLERTLIAVLGDFGRTPKINANQGGRDHWNYCYSLMLIGGGFRAGYVHGASDATGAFPARDPLVPGDVIATIYHCLGIRADEELRDQLNRPHRLVPSGLLSEAGQTFGTNPRPWSSLHSGCRPEGAREARRSPLLRRRLKPDRSPPIRHGIILRQNVLTIKTTCLKIARHSWMHGFGERQPIIQERRSSSGLCRRANADERKAGGTHVAQS